MNFNSLQAAKNFINQVALAHFQKHGPVPVWHMTVGSLTKMFDNAGYNFDEYAKSALNDAVQAGYIQITKLGGIIITKQGYNNIGNW